MAEAIEEPAIVIRKTVRVPVDSLEQPNPLQDPVKMALRSELLNILCDLADTLADGNCHMVQFYTKRDLGVSEDGRARLSLIDGLIVGCPPISLEHRKIGGNV